ncbi:MAG: UDP-N-acetylmuramoyl-L-alanine--D-glutamate ligase [Rhizomicrobium sp.]
MIPIRSAQGKYCAVFGLARSGLSAAKALRLGGATVVVWDDRQDARAAANEVGFDIRPWQEWPWEDLSSLILSPGVPLTHPAPHEVVLKAHEAGVEVIGDVELFAREIRPNAEEAGRAPVIAVTGTNGKSTTTALIGHILNACGYQAIIGGNIGTPVLDLPGPAGKCVYVLELSSFQIDLAPSLKSDVAVLCNITPDHIDRHGTLENYAAIKARLLKQASPDCLRVIGVDDSYSAAIFTAVVAAGGRAIPVSSGKILSRGIFVLSGEMYEAQSSHTAKIMDLLNAAHLPGSHNWQNAALAFAATRSFIKSSRMAATAIADFPGLKHRIEDVGRLGPIRLINDSKATNAEAAAKALACFEDVFWIAGGRPKSDGIASLAPLFPRIRKAFLIGEAAESFAATLGDDVDHVISGTLEAALAAACEAAAVSGSAHPVVLLSPACASFDQFRDFEDRGEAFRTLAARFIAASYKVAS